MSSPDHSLKLERWQGPPCIKKVQQYETLLSFKVNTVIEDLHSETFNKMICADHTFCHQISVREYHCTFINVSCYALRPHKSSAAIYESFFLWWSSLFLPANEPLDTLFRSSLARHCLGPWIALSFNLSRGHFPVLTFSCIELSLSPLFSQQSFVALQHAWLAVERWPPFR